MKQFERFIIYPMLFIALFFSFAGEEVQQTTAQQIYDEVIAKEITILNDKGDESIKMTGNNFGGSILVEDFVDPENHLWVNSRGVHIIGSKNDLYLNPGGIRMIPKENYNEPIILMGVTKSGGSFAVFSNKDGDSLVEIGSTN